MGAEGLGFGFVEVDGDADNVRLPLMITRSHAVSADLSRTIFEPTPAAEVQQLDLPLLLEVEGRVGTVPLTMDTVLSAAYLGDSEVGMRLELRDPATGEPLRGPAGPVCNPCEFRLSPATRTRLIALEDLIGAAGGFAQSPMAAEAVVMLSGDSANFGLVGVSTRSFEGGLDRGISLLQPRAVMACP